MSHGAAGPSSPSGLGGGEEESKEAAPGEQQQQKLEQDQHPADACRREGQEQHLESIERLEQGAPADPARVASLFAPEGGVSSFLLAGAEGLGLALEMSPSSGLPRWPAAGQGGSSMAEAPVALYTEASMVLFDLAETLAHPPRDAWGTRQSLVLRRGAAAARALDILLALADAAAGRSEAGDGAVLIQGGRDAGQRLALPEGTPASSGASSPARGAMGAMSPVRGSAQGGSSGPLSSET